MEDYTLTAINLDGDKGIVVVAPPSGGHTKSLWPRARPGGPTG